MEFKSYDAKSITQTIRTVEGRRTVGPKAPCGMSVSPGWVLTNGKYIRESEYLAIHSLAFLRGRLTG